MPVETDPERLIALFCNPLIDSALQKQRTMLQMAEVAFGGDVESRKHFAHCQCTFKSCSPTLQWGTLGTEMQAYAVWELQLGSPWRMAI